MPVESHETNPYLPPNSKIEDKNAEKGSPKKAVIVACSIDIFGTLFMSVILGFLYGFVLSFQGLSQQEIANSYYSQGMLSPLNLLNLIFGISITIYAGFLCAKIGKCVNYKLVTIYLVVVVVIMNLLALVAGQDMSSVKNIILTIISMLSGYFGAWLYIKEK